MATPKISKKMHSKSIMSSGLTAIFGYVLAAYLNVLNLPIPFPWNLAKPNFLLILVVYKCYEKPFNINIYFYFVLGLLYDLLTNGTLGTTSLSFVVISYLFQFFRIKLYTINVYLLTLFLLTTITIDKLINIWVLYLQHELIYQPVTWLSIPVTFAFWLILLLLTRLFGAYNYNENK